MATHSCSRLRSHKTVCLSPTAGYGTQGIAFAVDICRPCTHIPKSCLRPGPMRIDEVATLVSLATGPGRELVGLKLWPSSAVPVLLAELELFSIGTGVTVAWLATLSIVQDSKAGSTPAKAVVPHREYAVDTDVVASIATPVPTGKSPANGKG